MLVPALFGEDLLDDFFEDFNDFPFYDERNKNRKLSKQPYGQRADKLMKTDIRETANDYILAVELPGFKKEELQVAMENGYLTISAHRTEEKNNDRYLRRERFTGSMQRSFYVGDDVKQEDVKAQFANGVLKLTVPKKPEKAVEESKYISIEG